jgi:hypothetical protein
MKDIEVGWTEIKTFANDNSLTGRFIDYNGNYFIKVMDGFFSLFTIISKYPDNGSDLVDFETNYKSLWQKSSVVLVKPKPFADSDGFRFRGKGFSGSATANSTTNIEYKITEERYINGLELILSGNSLGDYVHFEIVDVDNILGYGAGLVLDRFADTWYMDPGSSRQGPYLLPYPAKIIANLYLRVAYGNTSESTSVSMKVNAFLHKKT